MKLEGNRHTGIIIVFFYRKAKGTFVLFIGQEKRYDRKKGGGVVQGVWMTGCSLVLGILTMICALLDLLRQRREVREEIQREQQENDTLCCRSRPERYISMQHPVGEGRKEDALRTAGTTDERSGVLQWRAVRRKGWG